MLELDAKPEFLRLRLAGPSWILKPKPVGPGATVTMEQYKLYVHGKMGEIKEAKTVK